MKLSEIVNTTTTDTLARLNKEKMPARAGFAVMLNVESIQGVLKTFDAKRSELVERFTTRDAEGKPVRPLVDGKPDETRVMLTDATAFSKELDDLLNTEVDVKPVKVTLEQFGEVRISPDELRAIRWMVSDV